MSEGKRATLISFGSQKVSEKRTKEIGKTIRISLVLPQSNEDTCPEFNYKEELAAVKKKDVLKKSKTEVNGLNPHGDDEDLKRIVAELEAKYGTDSYGKKRKKGRRDDYADIGMGYDESDSFIDNTDGYDEMIPEHVSPLHGGFYINSGALEFRADDKVSSDESSSSDDESVPEKLSSRKHPLESSDESEREKETDNTEERAAKKLKLSDTPKSKKHGDAEKLKHLNKKRPQDDKRPSATVRELLRQKRTDLDMNIPSDLQSAENLDKTAEEAKKPLSSVTLASINDTIESVVKATVEVANNHENKNVVVEASRNKVVLLSSEGESSRDSKTEEIVKLPENLPSDILEIIANIKQAASTSWEGKVKFFTGPVNKMLLSLEKKCRCLGKQSRMRVYEHLAPFVRCRKETLIRRAKNLFLESEQNKIETLSKELKNAIDRVMPTLLEAYEAECQKVLMKKFSKDGPESEENKALRMPHKRFPWTDDLRKMVKDIVVARKRCFLLEGKQRESLETKLNEFLKQHIQPLWPDGWMSMTALSKICGNVPDAKKQQPKDSAPAKPAVVKANNSSLELPQNLSMNPSLSITPLPAPPQQNVVPANSDMNLEVKLNNVLPDLEITKTVNSASNGVKPEVCDSKVEVHDQPPVLQPEVIPKVKMETLEKECQVIDLTGHADLKQRKPCQKPKSRYYQEGEKVVKVNSEGDDIQKVMEGLKVLHKMSSPIKTAENTTTSSPVSVIAFNKSYSPKSGAVSQPSTSSTTGNSGGVRPPGDYTKADFCTGFQEQFQKQLLGDVNFLKTSSSQPATSFKAANLLPSDDYMQNPNNNFAQHAQGTYNNIMEDMFTNLLSEYGYGRSALPKARQPKK